MHHAYAVMIGVARRTDDRGLAVGEDLPFVGEIDAREHVHERGLAAAVFAEQGQDLTFVHGEVDIPVGDDFPESLCDALHPYGDGS